MSQPEDNKTIVLNLYKCISGQYKNRESISKFTTDTHLIDHILYFESFVPSFSILIDEVIAEGPKVCVKVRYIGIQKGKINGNEPTFKEIEFPLVIGFQISSGKIMDHWIIGDQISLLKQLNMV